MRHRRVDPLGVSEQRHQVAATGHALAGDEAVLLGVRVETPIGPATHGRLLARKPAHNLADFAFAAKPDRHLDLLIRDRLWFAGIKCALQVPQHVEDAAGHPG
jgi:hypothetical protein